MSWEASACAHCFADVIHTAPTVQMALRWLSKNPAHKNMNPATRHLILTRIIVELINEPD